MTQGTISSRWQLLLLLSMLAAVVFVYWPGIHGGFIFDDFANIVDNKALHVTKLSWPDWIAAALSSPSTLIQRPLAMLTFAMNHYFTGLVPAPMKVTNIAIHVLNAVLVVALVRRLFRAVEPHGTATRRADEATLFASACWALHPIHLMAVLFVVQRMESMSHTFVFAGLLLYLAGRERQLRQAGSNGWRMILCGLVGFTVLGLLVKETAALLPLYAFCLELCIFHFLGASQKVDRRLWAMFGLLLFLPALIGILWLLPKSLGPGAFSSREFSLVERLLTEPRVLMDYLRWILAPDLGQLSLYHDDYRLSRSLWDPPTTLVSILAIPAMLGAAWKYRVRRPLVLLGLLWFFGAHLMTATFLPLELVFEHRNYFAALGICLVLADLLIRAPTVEGVRRAGLAVALAFVLVCAGVTLLRAWEWRNPVSLAVAEAAKHPTSPRATYYLGSVLASASDYRADSPLIAPAFEALDRARALPNSNILPDQAALVLASRTGTPLRPEWWQHMQTRLREHPIGPQELGGLGRLVNCSLEDLCHFPSKDMLATFAAALDRGDNPEVLSIYGNYVLNKLFDAELALRLWHEASRLKPREPQYRIGIIKLLIELGRYDEARIHIAQLRDLGRFGQYDSVAASLETRLRGMIAARRAASPQ